MKTSNIIGQRIIGIRALTTAEMNAEGWTGDAGIALILDSGTILYPSRDAEGNGPGVLFGHSGRTGFFLTTPLSTMLVKD